MHSFTSHPALSPARACHAAPAATRVGIVGAGYIAGYHLDILRRLPGVQVVGACDPNAERLEALCRQGQVPVGAPSLPSLLQQAKVDVIHVLVPPPYHFEVAEQALAARVHVLIEKPMALRAEECDRLVQLAREKGLLVGVNHNAVFHPLFQRLLRDLAAGKIGRVEHVVSVNNLPLAQLDSGAHDHWMFRDPANVLFEQGPHPLSQICAILGQVEQVATLPTGRRVLRSGAPFRSAWQMSLRCARGTAQLFLSFGRSFPDARLQVIGQDGTVQIDLMNGSYVLDRRTRYLEPVDRLLRKLNEARQTAWGGMRGFLRYALSTLRLTGRSDPYYLGMRDSITAFYQSVWAKRAEDPSAENGQFVIAGLERAAAGIERDEDRVEPQRAPAVLTQQRRDGEVLVLGGTGFIGRRLVPALAAAGYPVRLLARRPSLLPEPIRACQPSLFPGDVRKPEDVSRALEGCRAVIHLVTGAPSSWAEHQDLFVEGTRHVAEACLRSRGTRLLFASSIAAYYLGKRRTVITESTPLDPRPEGRAAYTRAKIAGEELLLELHRTRGLPVTIFRPGVVVGPGGLVEHSGAGYWPGPTHCISWGKGVHRGLPFVLADDVAKAFVLALETDGIAGQSFNLIGDVPLSAAEYLDILRAETGRDLRLHPCSLLSWWTTDVLKWLVKAAARKPENPFPSYRDLASRSLTSPFDCSRAKTILGWTPVADREEFIERGIRAALREVAP